MVMLRHPVRSARSLAARLGALEQQTGEIQSAVRQIRDQVARQASAAAVAEVRDSVHLAVRATTFRRRRTRVLFLVHLIEAWDSCQELYQLMAAADDFEPIVASIPRHFPGDSTATFEAEVHRALGDRGVPHLRFASSVPGDTLRLVKAIEPDIIFRQSQWDADIAEELSADRINFARTCLVPYETMNIVQNVPDEDTSNSAVDSAYHRGAWAVFCANDLMASMASAAGARGGQQFYVTGHPKADVLRSVHPRWPVQAGGRRRRIAWSAHHSIATGWSDFGMFPSLAEPMLAWAGDAPDTDFAFLAHPALRPFTGSPTAPFSRGDYDAWLDHWRALPNTAVTHPGEYPATLAAADLLIVDGLSMLVEFQLFERPLIFIERRDHRPFNDIGEMVRRGAHTATSVADVRALADQLLRDGSDPLQPIQRENNVKLFGPPGAAERILAVLRTLIAEEARSARSPAFA
jgi:hypothetical protein